MYYILFSFYCMPTSGDSAKSVSIWLGQRENLSIQFRYLIYLINSRTDFNMACVIAHTHVK